MKLFLTSLWIGAAVLLLPHFLLAESRYQFSHFSLESGLPNNAVTCSLQDRNGFMWFGTRDGLCRFDGYEFRLFEGEELDSRLNGIIMSLCEDPDGLIWFSTTDGVGYYDPGTDCLREVELPGGITTLCADTNGFIWMAPLGSLMKYDIREGKTIQYDIPTRSGWGSICREADGGDIWVVEDGCSIARYLPESDSFQRYPILSERELAAGEHLERIVSLGSHSFLMTTSKGRLLRIRLQGNAGVESLATIHRDNPPRIYAVLPISTGQYWIGCGDGLYIYNDNGGLQAPLPSHPDDAYALSSSNIRSLCRDRDGNIWIGTNFSGIDLCHTQSNTMASWSEHSANYPISGLVVRAIIPGLSGDIWVGTEDGKLNHITPWDNQTESFDEKNGIPGGASIHSLAFVDDKLWILTYDSGILVFDTEKKRVTAQKQPAPGLRYENLFKTQNGTMLLGTTRGLYRYNPAFDNFTRIEDFGTNYIHCLYQDASGLLWVGTYGSGLFVKDLRNGPARQYVPGDGSGLQALHITSFFEDHRHRMWIGTEGSGLACMEQNGENACFKHYTRRDGLPSNITSAMFEDKDGTLWVTTSKGLFKFDTENRKVMDVRYTFTKSLGNQFSYGACYRSPLGTVYLGTTDGMLSFNPDNLVENHGGQLYFTGFYLGQDIVLTAPKGHFPLNAKKLTIPYKDAGFLRVTYTSLNYSDQMPSRYTCKLQGRRRTLSSTSADNYVTYTNLSPGNYTLDLCLAGNGDNGPHKTLSIKVQPPLLASSAALIAYIAIIAAAAWWIIRRKQRNREYESMLRTEKLEAEKQKEIYDTKIRFFTNITHEFRTPLTLIKMPLDRIIRQKGYKETSEDDIRTIQDNTNRLLDLTGQLLDIRKMEQDPSSIVLVKSDIRALVRKCCRSFEPVIKERGIALTMNLPEKKLETMCAPDAVRKIVDNLLSNAVKYTRSTIDVILENVGEHIYLRVNSNSAPLAPAERIKIFEPFYRSADEDLKSASGTGLGLTYARTLAELHKGTLTMDDDYKGGNSFVLDLPLVEVAPDAAPAENASPEPEPEHPQDLNKHTLLLVEDDHDMRKFLETELHEDYNILTASNGREAMEILQNERVDLVVSDIMMPEMDGNELCEWIKGNLEVSHIPIILLTAAAGVEMRMETLRLGADGYIEKPFSIELLKVNIENLFRNREISNNQFVNSPLSHFSSGSINRVDQAFMEKLHSIIMRNISDENLNYEMLASTIGISKSTLYRKIKANSGLSASDYIRVCRLKKAAEMLSSNEYRINEVADLMGFSSPSYFATCFQKQFGISPSNFLKGLSSKD